MNASNATPLASGKKSRVTNLVRVGFVALLAGAVVWKADAHAILDALRKVGLFPFALCLVCEWLFFAVESLRIWELARRRYPLKDIWRSRLLSCLVGTILPGLASTEVARVFLLDRVRPGNKAYIALLFVANRLYGLLSLAGLWLIIIVLFPDSIPAPYRAFRWWAALACIMAMIAPLGFHLRGLRVVLFGLLQCSPKRARALGRRFYLAALDFSGARRWTFALTTSVFTNLVVVLEFTALSQATDAGVTFEQWAIFVPLVAVATFLPLGLGAVGTQDAAMLAVAKLLKLPVEPVLAVSVSIHVLRYLGPAPGLLYARDLTLTISEIRRSLSGLVRKPPS